MKIQSRVGLPWTPEEDAAFRVMYADGLPLWEIGRILGRNEDGCDRRRVTLKIKARPRMAENYTQAKRAERGGRQITTFTKSDLEASKRHERACTLHLIDLVREFGGGTVGEAKAAYRARHEHHVEPGHDALVSSPRLQPYSYCGSPAAMCEG